MQAELVRGLADAVTCLVVADLAAQVGDRQADRVVACALAQVEHIRDLNPACHEATRSDHLRLHSLHRLDQMAVGLDDHRVGGPAEIENGVGALGTPATSGATAAERFLPRRDVALKAARDRGRAASDTAAAMSLATPTSPLR